jgi:hypothetical protein
MEFTLYYVGKRFVFKGKIVKAMAETDSGNVKVVVNGEEVWTTADKLSPIDGQTRGFKVFALPELAKAA